MIKAWSFSRLSVFEQCKYRAKLAYVDKIPEPIRPLPPGKNEHANDRGHRVHEAAELFVRGGVELVPELRLFEAEFLKLRELYAEKQVKLEEEWSVDKDWNPTTWNSATAWCRIKTDAMVFLEPSHGVVIDYKTGKRKGNEVKHAEQGQLYQLAAFMRFPELREIDVEFWYTDVDEVARTKFSRQYGLAYWNKFNNRGTAMTTATAFPPSASIFNCRWCPYHKTTGSGDCIHGV